MRVVLFYDQTQAGAGGKERPNVELAVEKGGIGSYHMFEKNFKAIGANVVATTYCGNGFFFDNKDDVVRKIAGLAQKLKADMVVCGPCFNYEDYGHMAAITAEYIETHTDIKAVAMFSQECTEALEYKDKVTCIKMPKKGGTGLTTALDNLTKVIDAKYKGESKESIQEYLY